MKYVFKTVSAMILLAAAAFASNEQTSKVITLSTTPTQLPCTTQRYATQFRIAVQPGGTGKVYIGNSSMNTSTLAGVVGILYPNAGAQSEVFKLTGGTWDLCQFYIAGGVSNEKAFMLFEPGNGANPINTWIRTGPFSISGSSAETVGTGYATHVRIQVVPGQSGKVAVGRETMIGNETNGTLNSHAKVLWPNSGTLSQHNGWSELWQYGEERGDGASIDLAKLAVYPYVNSETPIVAAWGSGGTSTLRNLQAGVVSVTNTPTQFSSTLGNVGRLYFSVSPGYCGKVYIGDSQMNISTLSHVAKVLYPTSCNGGWSEQYSVIGDDITGNVSPASIYIAGDSYGDKITWWATELNNCVGLTGTSLAACQNSNSNKVLKGQLVSLTGTPTALAGSANKNKRMTISVVPGGSGKVYIGTSSMNISTLAGVYAILYPNSIGRMSEQFELVDRSSCSNLDTSNVYVAGDVTGDLVTVALTDPGESNQSYCSTFGTLHAQYAGLSTSSAWPWISNGGAANVENIKFQVIPGGSGKARAGPSNFYSAFAASQPDSSYAGVFHEFWPNTGSYSVGEGWSERFEYHSTNGSVNTTASEWQKYFAVSSEYFVVGLFTH